MGISAKPPVVRLRNRQGIALPSAIFGIVIVGMITAGAWSITELDLKATNNRVDAATALRLAHTAETHAIAVLRNTMMKDTTFNRLLRGYDNDASTSDDGVLDGYPALDASVAIPDTGRLVKDGRYFVRITDDPREIDNDAFADTNRRLLIRCRSVTTGGSSAEINVVVANYQLPALAVEGNLEISASALQASSSGGCGGIHANGNIGGGGKAKVDPPGEISATGSISPTITGTAVPNHPPVEIPDLNPSDFCGFAGAIHIGSGDPPDRTYTWTPGVLTTGTYCITGNVEFQSDFGAPGAPVTVTVIASGSIKVGGKKIYMQAHHPDGIVLMAGGDLDLQSDASFEGMIYAGAQCYVSGKPTITGQMVCKNKDPQTEGTNLFDRFSGTYGMQISGDATFNFTCNSLLSAAYRVVAWYPTIGT